MSGALVIDHAERTVFAGSYGGEIVQLLLTSTSTAVQVYRKLTSRHKGFEIAAFAVLGSVVLLNLLVAMMGDTYARVSENATAKWRLARARILLALERRVSVATRDRLAAGVWIVVDGARFLQVQLVRGVLRDAAAKTP